MASPARAKRSYPLRALIRMCGVSGPRRRVTWREGGRRRARPSERARAARSVWRREMPSWEYVWQGGGGGREGRLHPLCACSGPRGL